jgi:Phage derived protein Gp49-like (DUF891)
MKWQVTFHPIFEAEFDDLPQAVQDELLAKALLLETLGPQLGRPSVDTLKGSRHQNLKELRFQSDQGVWPLLLIQRVRQFCWWRETSLALDSGSFIDRSSIEPMNDLITIFSN